MTATQKGLWALAGVILGVLAAWAVEIAYLVLLDIERGSLVVPFALVGLGALALSRRSDLRPLAVGVVVGAAAETAFFLYLFATLSRGLEGL